MHEDGCNEHSGPVMGGWGAEEEEEGGVLTDNNKYVTLSCC